MFWGKKKRKEMFCDFYAEAVENAGKKISCKGFSQRASCKQCVDLLICVYQLSVPLVIVGG